MDEATLCFRFALGTIFFLSGLAKVPNRDEFEAAVRGYEIGPPGLSRVAAFVIPPAEAVAGIFLLIGLAVRATAVGVAILLLVFSSAVVVNLVRGRRITCGCFGTVSQREISALAVVRNLSLVCLAVIVAWRAPAVLAVDDRLHDTSTGLSTLDGVALMIAGSLGALALAIAQEAINVLRSRASFERTRVKTT